MRVFVTGATGFVGSAVVEELLKAGHQVLGLARSDESAEALKKAGALVHKGTLNDLESLRRAAAEADGVIHTAFVHDFAHFVQSCETDRVAIEAMGKALEGSNKPFIVTSGIGLLRKGKKGNEQDSADKSSPAAHRAAAEDLTLDFGKKGVRSALVRLPPSVHGDGDHGFVPMLIGMAKEKGSSAYIGEGQNLWPAVHRLDAAKVYRLALEKGTAGAIYHAVAEEGIPFKEIATVIGKHLKLPVVSKSPAEAQEHFTWFAHFAAMDVPASSEITQQKLGWKGKEIGLLQDIDKGRYFSK